MFPTIQETEIRLYPKNNPNMVLTIKLDSNMRIIDIRNPFAIPNSLRLSFNMNNNHVKKMYKEWKDEYNLHEVKKDIHRNMTSREQMKEVMKNPHKYPQILKR